MFLLTFSIYILIKKRTELYRYLRDLKYFIKIIVNIKKLEQNKKKRSVQLHIYLVLYL